MTELIEPIMPFFVVLITLVALSGLVVLVLSIFRRWAKTFYNQGYRDGRYAQYLHDQMCKEEGKAENE